MSHLHLTPPSAAVPELRKRTDATATSADALLERRFVVTGLQARSRVEARDDEDGDQTVRSIAGYAAKFDQETPIWRFVEVIRAGAFARAVEEDDVRALFNHDPNLILGRTKSGTLRLEEDAVGLRIEVDLPDTQWGRDLYTSIERGDVDQMSFAFTVVKEAWTQRGEGEDAETLRELLEVRLYDVSPVTYPAYDDTEVGVVEEARALVEARAATPDAPPALRRLVEDRPPAAAPSDVATRRRRLALLEATR